MSQEAKIRGFMGALKALPMPPLPTKESWAQLRETWDVGPQEALLVDTYLEKSTNRALTYLSRKMYDEALILLESLRKIGWNRLYLLERLESELKGLNSRTTGSDLIEWRTLLQDHIKKLRASGLAQPLAINPLNPVVKSKSLKPYLPWIVILASLLLSIPLLNVIAFLTNQKPLRDTLFMNTGTPEKSLPLTISSPEGIEVEAEIQNNQLILYPDAPLFTLKARLRFPDQEMKEVIAHVKLLDTENRVLWDKEMVLLTEDDPLLLEDQSLELAMRTILGPWGTFLGEVQISIKKALRGDETSAPPTPLPVQFKNQPPQGILPHFQLMKSLWSHDFATLSHTMDIEVLNQGLKPMEGFSIKVDWFDKGNLLESKEVPVLHPSNPPLTPGSKMRFRFGGELSREMYGLSPTQTPEYTITVTDIKSEDTP